MALPRKIVQPLLMLAAIGSGLTVVTASLRSRPNVRQPERVQVAYAAEDFSETVRAADRELREMALGAGVHGAELQVASPADSLTVARRLSLALVGSGLSLEELQALRSVPEDQQIRWLTSYLLEDPRWSDYFAERFSRAFVGTNDGPFLLFRRRKFNAWLSQQFSEGKPYDQVVREMIAAEGLWTDTPQVNFITATMDDENNGRADPIRLAGRTSRVFLAQRIDCLQCHDDFLGDLNFGTSENPASGIQQHFHGLAAFFSGVALPEAAVQGLKEDGRPYEFEFLGDSEPQEVAPTVPYFQDLLPDAGKPRVRLAKWVTHPDNKAFARATVNRVWALMFSRPLVEPVDNIPLDARVPKVLDTLAEDFVAHGHDLRRLVRLISETEAFRRDSRAEFEVTEEHESAWAVFPVTQLRPEQVAGSMFQACRLTALDANSPILSRLKVFGDTQEFLKRFGDRGEDEFDSEAVTIAQRLVMMNGNLVTERTKVDLINNASTRIATLVKDNVRAVELAFLASLNREPTQRESERFVEFLDGKYGNDRSRSMGDMYWAIMNSTEFSWNH